MPGTPVQPRKPPTWHELGYSHPGDRLREGEVLTIIRSKYSHPYGCYIQSNMRALYGAEHVYFSGISKPNFPLPVVLS